jgi:hypothetical protein
VEDSSGASGPDFLQSLLQRSYRVQRPGTGEMRHGTEGWKCLETSFRVGSCDALPHVPSLFPRNLVVLHVGGLLPDSCSSVA